MYAIFSLALLLQPAAAEINPRYQDCVTLVEADIEIGRIAAQQWVSEGGGAMAQHCLAVADLGAGFPKLAAARLEEIADRKDAGDPEILAKILAQAAEAWLQADLTENAKKAVNKAFALTPGAGELSLVAARIHEVEGKPLEVIRKVTDAESVGLGSAAGFVARGRAHFNTGNYEAAANDVVTALSIDPGNLDALVLRGELQQTGIAIDAIVDRNR